MNLWILFKSSILAGLHWQCTGRRGASPGYCQVGGVVQKPGLPTRPLLSGMCARMLSHLVMSNSLQLHDCSLLGSFVHGILQARIFAMPSSRSPQPGDWTWVSHIASRFFTIWTTREALYWQEGFFFVCLFFLRWLGFVFLDWPAPSPLARENRLFMGPLWSMAIDISGLLDSSAPILGYRGGKKKTQATHGCVVPQLPTSLISLPSFPFLSESFLYFINHVWEEF